MAVHQSMQGSRSSDYLTNLSQVRSAPKWSFKGKAAVARKLETPGPGAYTTTGVEKVKSSVGNGFGFGSSPRDPMRPSTAPGPGQYSPSPRLSNATKQGAGFGTAVRQTKKGHATSPGPGAYAHSARIGADGPKFTVNARREGFRAPDTPGPGTYQATDDALATTSKTSSRAVTAPKWGFGTSPREARVQSTTPGPAAYVAEVKHAKSAPKYSISARRESGRSTETPGPGAYGGPHTQFGY